jgi:hypothetical protein
MQHHKRVRELVSTSFLIASILSCGAEEASGPAANQPPAVASVEVTPATALLVAIDDEVQLVAIAKDAGGVTI